MYVTSRLQVTILFTGLDLRPGLKMKNLKTHDFRFFGCCPAGVLDLEKFSFSFFLFFLTFLKCQNIVICLDLSFGTMLKLLVVKSPIQRTSQNVKWTSGARVMTFLFIICSLFVHYSFIILLFVHYLFIICSLFVHYFIIRSLFVHYLFIIR